MLWNDPIEGNDTTIQDQRVNNTINKPLLLTIHNRKKNFEKGWKNKIKIRIRIKKEVEKIT